MPEIPINPMQIIYCCYQCHDHGIMNQYIQIDGDSRFSA